MTVGPHEANLRGELALEQLHFIKDVARADVQRDIDRRHVVEVPEVEIVYCRTPLTPSGPHYGIKNAHDEPPTPTSPGVNAYPGRYRAWVLPTSRVAVALEPLEDEASYLRRHRAELFALQHVEDSHLVPLTELRLGRIEEFGMAPLNLVASLAGWLMNGRRRAYTELTFEKRRAMYSVGEPFSLGGYRVYLRLVVGTTYRIRPIKTWRHVIEADAPEPEATGVGPYR